MKNREMRIYNAIGSIAVILSFAGFLSGRPQDADSPRPQNPDAGRIRTLTPVLTISDEDGSKFYFKRPSQPQCGPDGSIYVLDEKQIIRFDAQGRFVRNYFRAGQGPGELNYVIGYAFETNDLIVLNASPRKFVRFDPDGKFVSEAPLPQDMAPLLLIGCARNNALILKGAFPPREEMKGLEGTVEIRNPILALPLAGGREKQIGVFTTRMYYQNAAGGVGGSAMAPFGKHIIKAWGNDALAVFDDEEYAVKLLDPATGKVIQTLRRSYPRVKTPPEERDGIPTGTAINGREVRRPAPKYAPDIVHLLARGEELWVVTSTRIKEKGVLVDVFDRKGIYSDSFYLSIPIWPEKHLTRPDPIALQDDFLLCLEKTEDGTYLLRKYKIGN